MKTCRIGNITFFSLPSTAQNQDKLKAQQNYLALSSPKKLHSVLKTRKNKIPKKVTFQLPPDLTTKANIINEAVEYIQKSAERAIERRLLDIMSSLDSHTNFSSPHAFHLVPK